MSTHRLTARHKAAAVLAISTGVASSLGALAIQQAGADPGSASPYAGVGSDTTQDVMNALAGAVPWPGAGSSAAATPKFFSPSANPTGGPILAQAANGWRTIVSWDAIPFGGTAAAPGCIVTKGGQPAMERPNGSGNGITALRASINGTSWQASTATCAAVIPPASSIDFARSSRGPNNTTTSLLTFVPFARDAVMYLLESNGPDDVSNMSTADLKTATTDVNGTIVIGSTTVKACLPQPGSGTRSFWLGAIGAPSGQAVPDCNTIEEHDGNAFHTFAQSWLGTHANSAVLMPFSVSQWVAQGNGFGIDRSGTFRVSPAAKFGDPDNIGGATGPFSGTAGTYAGNSAFYNFTSGLTVGTYGRDVYNVMKTTKLSNTIGVRDNGLKELFNTNGTVNANGICSSANARTVVHNFGFLDPVAACGSIALTGES